MTRLVSKTHLSETAVPVRTIRLFSVTLQTSWAVLLFLTVASELFPLPPVAPRVLYAYILWKAILFVLLGFMTPLAFWRFNSIGFGLLFSIVAAASVEILQSFSEGHRASFLEFAAKLMVLFVGFAFALNTRYNGIIRLGPFCRYLVNPHQKN